jgi:hypothetical protein
MMPYISSNSEDRSCPVNKCRQKLETGWFLIASSTIFFDTSRSSLPRTLTDTGIDEFSNLDCLRISVSYSTSASLHGAFFACCIKSKIRINSKKENIYSKDQKFEPSNIYLEER